MFPLSSSPNVKREAPEHRVSLTQPIITRPQTNSLTRNNRLQQRPSDNDNTSAGRLVKSQVPFVRPSQLVNHSQRIREIQDALDGKSVESERLVQSQPNPLPAHQTPKRPRSPLDPTASPTKRQRQSSPVSRQPSQFTSQAPPPPSSSSPMTAQPCLKRSASTISISSGEDSDSSFDSDLPPPISPLKIKREPSVISLTDSEPETEMPPPAPLAVKDEPPPSQVQVFFSQFPEFKYNPHEQTMSQFNKLTQEYNLSGHAKRTALQLLRDAIAKQFNQEYGTDIENLESWQTLCQACGVDPIPQTIEGCKEVIGRTHVNIVDLIDFSITGERPLIHASEIDLSIYSKKTDKIYPRDNAYAKGLLRYLLRHIRQPSSKRRVKRKA